MSCSKNSRSFDKKPPLTAGMKKKGQTYVWKEVMGNPNLYCWIPVSKKTAHPLDLHIEEINIQDIPIPPHNEDIIAQLAEEAEHGKQIGGLKKLSEPGATLKDIVSVDDPQKYPVVKEFIRHKGLKLYGGAAINSYLPREDKFYNPHDIPDYDFFSPDPWNDAVELSDAFHQAGYKYVEARAGIHKGTYKVFVNLWPVADISYMPKKEFDHIQTKTIDGIKVVHPLKLLESMYKEFSEPYANPARWPKVATREKLLRKWTRPLDKKFACSKTLFSGGIIKIDDMMAGLLEITYKYLRDKKALFTGPIAYNTYMEVGGASRRVLVDHYRVLSETAHEDIQELMTILMKRYEHLEITTSYYPARELNNTGYKLYAIYENKYVPICEITNLTSCTPFQYIFGRYIVSIDYLKYDLYDQTVFSEDRQRVKDSLCKLKYLEVVQHNYYRKKKATEEDKTPFQRFVTSCRGPYQHNIKTEILNRWLDRVARKDEVIKVFSKKWKIRKFPRDEIPKECKDRAKEDCIYPCAWNKFIGRCQGLPTGTYRPGEDNEDINYEYM
uniref:Poly(A) polymerase catalytic subunit domain-containing protein n=1 Tax=viral metagenome TaxID=1070528 RepID=A0A6C0EMA3_9ZZZZ